MLKLYTARLGEHDYELPAEFQNYLDNLRMTGKMFQVEEYYNNTMTVFVTKDGLFLYRTKEVERTGKNNIKQSTVECTLSKAKDLQDLYKNLRDRRTVLDVEDVKEVYKQIEYFVKSSGLL